jgi:demethylmenaquinone methyltransferase / 2-methoxy-6-polyprenyl-1,4-benzoquinol methylase
MLGAKACSYRKSTRRPIKDDGRSNSRFRTDLQLLTGRAANDVYVRSTTCYNSPRLVLNDGRAPTCFDEISATMTETPDPSQREIALQQPPHPVLPDYYRHAAERQTRVNAMFDAAARHYDRIERLMSFGTGQRYRRQALERAGLVEGMRVLDVGCGTGVIAAQAAALGGRVVALDPSAGMLQQARARGVSLMTRGLGEALPFADNGFDLLTMGYALRHVADLRLAFSEFQRVLRSGGRALLLEITAPEACVTHAALKLYLKHLVPTLTRISERRREAAQVMTYYWDTIEQCVPPAVIMEALGRAGFARVERRVEFGILSQYTAVKA